MARKTGRLSTALLPSLLLALFASACTSSPGDGQSTSCTLPPASFWVEAGLDREALDVVEPQSGSDSVSAVALDQTAVVLGLCGPAATLESVGELSLETDAGRPPQIAKVITSVNPEDGTQGAAAAIVTPIHPSATVLTLRGGRLPAPATFSLPEPRSRGCDLRTSHRSVDVRRCGGWVTLELADVPRDLLADQNYLDIVVRQGRKPIEVMPFVETRQGRRALLVSGPFKRRHAYTMILPGRKFVSFKIS